MLNDGLVHLGGVGILIQRLQHLELSLKNGLGAELPRFLNILRQTEPFVEVLRAQDEVSLGTDGLTLALVLRKGAPGSKTDECELFFPVSLHHAILNLDGLFVLAVGK